MRIAAMVNQLNCMGEFSFGKVRRTAGLYTSSHADARQSCKPKAQRPMSNVRCFNKSARRTNDNSVLRARPPHNAERLRLSEVGFYLFHEASPHESEAQPPVILGELTVRQSLTAVCGGRAASINRPKADCVHIGTSESPHRLPVPY